MKENNLYTTKTGKRIAILKLRLQILKILMSIFFY